MEKLYARNENLKVTFRVRVGDEEPTDEAVQSVASGRI